MKSSLLATLALAALSVAITLPTASAERYSPSEFRTELNSILGSKRGPSAFNAAARFYQKALGDKANKKFANQYSNILVKAMRGGRVSPSLVGRSTNAFTKALLAGYFKGRAYNLNDAKFTKSFEILLKALPLSQKTETTSQSIYNSLVTYSSRRGTSADVTYNYYLPISISRNIPAPTS